jgi:hypothetical protein
MKYQLLIKKIRKLKAGKSCSNAYFSCYLNKTQSLSQEELALIEETLETIQFLEIVFKARKKLENYEKSSLL